MSQIDSRVILDQTTVFNHIYVGSFECSLSKLKLDDGLHEQLQTYFEIYATYGNDRIKNKMQVVMNYGTCFDYSYWNIFEH